jgi:hypothetical protein
MNARIQLIKAVLAAGTEKSAQNLQQTLAKAAACWKGYERVPGTKAMTPGSCRPVGEGKDKKKKEKKAFINSAREALGKYVQEKTDPASYINTDNLEAILKHYSKVKPQLLRLLQEEQELEQ